MPNAMESTRWKSELMDQGQGENQPFRPYSRLDLGLLPSKMSLLFHTMDVDQKREEEDKYLEIKDNNGTLAWFSL
jgi:hypothetical protein